MITKTLSKETIDTIFATAKVQWDYVFGLYRTAIDNWDSVIKVNGYPEVSPNTSEYIWQKAIRYDKEYHPDVLSGGAWMNNGWGIDKTMPDWAVQYDEDIIEYGTELELQDECPG